MLHLHELDNIYEFSPLSASYQGPIPLHLTPLTTSHLAYYSTPPSRINLAAAGVSFSATLCAASVQSARDGPRAIYPARASRETLAGAYIVQGNAEQSTFLSALEDALSEWPLKHIWKECEDVEMHGILTISIETMSSVVIGCRYCYNNTAVYCWQDVKYQHDSMILRAYSMDGISGLSNRGARAAAVGVVLRCLYPKYNNSRICMIK